MMRTSLTSSLQLDMAASDAGRRTRNAPGVPTFRLAQRAEAGAQFVGEGLWLFPRREMPAFGQPVVMDEVGVGFLRPALGGGVDLVGKDTHRRRNRDAFGREKGEVALPIQPRRGDRRVGEPVEGDIVEDVVATQPL